VSRHPSLDTLHQLHTFSPSHYKINPVSLGRARFSSWGFSRFFMSKVNNLRIYGFMVSLFFTGSDRHFLRRYRRSSGFSTNGCVHLCTLWFWNLSSSLTFIADAHGFLLKGGRVEPTILSYPSFHFFRVFSCLPLFMILEARFSPSVSIKVCSAFPIPFRSKG